ncbi:MAG: ATP-dependent Clp protease ATP-binding subunit ClpC [Parcubacteria group bacterium Gr01-1014_18]|nr:MAG: ATP-dependent Clp protease ATP-binding subunit ClpC [Parcubacteria group bacterium Greene0416_36]TSC81209.1 MAG: ATP-dependent Clp protease ATP-binding subunit ClpC [Parcubacteria group bacterium Gr01-1014_18]TSC99206.1 MAG: ATP-dependent Clp protease ATP-binding subunit ClpC [Parcubacteria group bacterium Greene1014_20]TSD07436.1 MAG: ATP-dependent Clp protease ATP-binding subunit ClpC [Parcubacteria group bacterium Greene0714_2]
MIVDKFTRHLKESLRLAYKTAWTSRHPQISLEHLLYGLSSQKGSIASRILEKNNFVSDFFLTKIQEINHKLAVNLPENAILLPLPSELTKKILKKTILLAHKYTHSYISTEHVLSVIWDEKAWILEAQIVAGDQQYDLIKNQIKSILDTTTKFPEITENFVTADDEGEAESDGETDPAWEIYDNNRALSLFGTDLTSEKTQKHIDPVIGREKEIERITEILSRRTKNNPLLVGEPGVGKTAIVEGLAKKIQEGKVPPVLWGRKIISIDMAAVLSGTIYRGEFEARLKQIIEEAQRDPEIILFIDELHMIVGAGSSSGSMDAANILKPALARGEIHCIGSTTFGEYQKHIQSDPALSRRFQTLIIEEPTEEATLSILKGLRAQYEQFHRALLPDEILASTVQWASKYLPARLFPDKAIDIMDEAAAKSQIRREITPLEQKLEAVYQKQEKIQRQKHKAVLEEKYEAAVLLRDQEAILNKNIKKLEDLYDREQKNITDQVTEQDIAQAISSQSGIPVSKILQEDNESLISLERILRAEILGQETAITAITDAIRRFLALGNTKGGLLSLLLAGPSGVGKTESAKIIARELFGSDKKLIRLDMSEYSDKFNLSKLLGAPPGYVGYGEGSILSTKLLQNPHSVILFDEMEKAHPDITSILLGMLENGEIIDSSGRKISLKNNIIILAANTNSASFGQSGIGFGMGEKSKNADASQRVHENLKEIFKPELLGRINAKIIFQTLTQETLAQIAWNAAQNFCRGIQKEKNIQIMLTQKELLDLIGPMAEEKNARDILHKIDAKLGNILTDYLRNQKTTKSGIIKLDKKKDQWFFLDHGGKIPKV